VWRGFATAVSSIFPKRLSRDSGWIHSWAVLQIRNVLKSLQEDLMHWRYHLSGARSVIHCMLWLSIPNHFSTDPPLSNNPGFPTPLLFDRLTLPGLLKQITRMRICPFAALCWFLHDEKNRMHWPEIATFSLWFELGSRSV